MLTRLALGKDFAACMSSFDRDFYQGQKGTALSKVVGPALHYFLVGHRKGVDPNRQFRTDWYLDANEDVRQNGINPFAHYMRLGWLEDRDPSPDFSTAWYLARYPDIEAAGLNPLQHFLVNGEAEGRLPTPPKVMRTIVDEAPKFIRAGQSAPAAAELDLLRAEHSSEGIDDVQASGWKESAVNDPKLYFRQAVASGVVRLRVQARFRKMRASAAREAVFEIYFDPGSRHQPDQAYTYHVKNDVLDVDEIVLLERDATCIVVDPINTDCEFILDVLQIGVLPVRTAVCSLYEKFCWSGDVAVRSDREFLRHMSWGNVRKFVRQQGSSLDPFAAGYDEWIERRRLSPAQRQRLDGSSLDSRPGFSILMPTYRSDLRFLEKAIFSVQAQTYPLWELCIVDDGSRQPDLRRFLEEQAPLDPRVKVAFAADNLGIAAATNQALAMATGEFIGLLDHDDELAPQALYLMAKAINEVPAADMLYSDEDKIDVDGVRSGPMFKPDWSPEFFLSCMYTCHLGVYRRSVVEAVGRFRSEFDFAQDYDLAFRVSAAARAIVHVPDVLYHWRVLPTSTAGGAEAKPTAELAARRAVQAHIDAVGLNGTALPGPFAGSHRVQLDLIGEPAVSIVIPTAGRRIAGDEHRWFVVDLLRSIKELSTYRNFEIVLVDNGDIEPPLEKAFADFDLVRVCYDARSFNIAEKLNLGVQAARSAYVILLNDDMSIITPGWIEELLSWIQRPGIVASGGKLLFPDRTVQHAGVLLLAQGPSHAYYGAADTDAGFVGSAVTIRNYSAVTGACLAVSKRDYQAVGGFDPSFRINYNDIDFCMKLLKLGRIVYTPYAKLFHYESVSRGEAPSSELRAFNARWDHVVGSDAAYNINLSQSVINAVTLFPSAALDP